MDTYKVRVPGRVVEHVLTSSAAVSPKIDKDPLAARLVGTLRKANQRKDGSRTVVLDEDEAAALREYAEVLEDGARDNISVDPGPSLAEIRAAQAVIKALAGAPR